MNYRKLEDSVEIVDDTSPDDDPYASWEQSPDNKFIEELLDAGFSIEEIYSIDIDGERGIMINYNLFPHEILRWDDKKKVMRLKLVYTPFQEFKKALKDLGVLYDKAYWDEYSWKK